MQTNILIGSLSVYRKILVLTKNIFIYNLNVTVIPQYFMMDYNVIYFII